MINLSFEELQAWLALFLWPFLRISAFVMAAPLFGHSSLPAQVKIGLAFLLTVTVSATLPPLPEVPLMSWAGVGIMVEQMLVGLAMGLALHIMLTVVQVAGEFIGLQMGLGFASFFSQDTGANTMILSRWLYMLTLLVFLAVNGHLLMIGVLATSFTTLPVGLLGLELGAFDMLARFASVLFASGLLLSLPLVGALLIINLSLGILNRAAPQFTVFTVGFPLSLTAGLFLLSVLLNDFAGFLLGLFNQGFTFTGQLVEAMNG